MPNIKSAIKRVKQTETRNELKSSQRAAVVQLLENSTLLL